MSRRTHVPTGGRRQAWVMDDRTARTAVTALVGAGLLPVEATDRAVAELTVDAGTRRDRGPLVEVAAWLGAALVLAAAGLFLADGWSDLGRGGQAAALGGIAVLLAGAGLLARRPAHTRRLAGGLLSAAAVSLGFAVGLAVDAVVGTPWSDWPGVAGALTVAAAGALAHRLVPGVAAQLAVIAGLFAAVPSTFQLAGLDTEQWAWATEVALAGGWLLLAERGILSDRVVAVALGSSWALVGAQLPVADGEQAWVGYLLTMLVALTGFTAYLRTARWPYVAVAVLAVTLVVPEAVTDWTKGSVGPAGAVLLAGLALLGGALAALWSGRGRIRRGQPA